MRSQYSARMSGIIFADSDTRYALALRRRFEMSGVSFASLSDGNEFSSLAREMHPEAIVCSLRVDHADGFEAVKRIREDEVLKFVPFVVLTDLADVMDIRRCRSLGCVAYFIKRHTKPEYLFAYLRHSGYLA
jgi:CheY-like chemotaxis protein